MVTRIESAPITVRPAEPEIVDQPTPATRALVPDANPGWTPNAARSSERGPVPEGIKVQAPTGHAGAEFDAVIRKLGLKGAVADGVITREEAQLAGVAFEPLIQWAAQSGDPTSLDSYSEVLNAMPEVKALTPEALISAETRGDYVVLAPSGAHRLLQPLLKQRAMKDHRVALVSLDTIGSSPDQIAAFVNQARRTWKEPPRFLLLVGTTQTLPPTQFPVATEGHRFMTGPTLMRSGLLSGFGKNVTDQLGVTSFPSDQRYSAPDERGLPTVAVGRMATSDSTTLQGMISRIIRYESERQPGLWQATSVVTDGNPDWGKTMDRVVNEFAHQAIPSVASPDRLTSRISFNPNHATGTEAATAQSQALKGAPLFFEYFGHGSQDSVDGLDARTAMVLNPEESTPFVALMACLTGRNTGSQLFGSGQALTETLTVGSKVALTALGAADISLPHSNAALGAALATEVQQGTSRTVGEAVVASKRRYAAGDVDGSPGVVDAIGHGVWTAGRAFGIGADDRRVQLNIYNLSGDPALELRRPEALEVQSNGRAVRAGDTLGLTLTLPASVQNGEAYLRFEPSGEWLTPNQKNAHRTLLLPLVDGQLGAPVQLPPQLPAGSYTVRVIAVGDQQTAVGSLTDLRVVP